MIRRTPVRKKRSKPRRGRVIDKAFLSWMAMQPCLVHGWGCGTALGWLTIHHVRDYGSPKNDRRTLRLCVTTHQQIASKTQSIEALGKDAWEKLHHVSIEAAIADYNSRYENERAA